MIGEIKIEDLVASHAITFETTSKCIIGMSKGISFIEVFCNMLKTRETVEYHKFFKTCLIHISGLAQYADESQKKFTDLFALPKEDPFKLISATLTNPVTTKLVTDIETAFAEIEETYLTKIEDNLNMKSEEEIEEKRIREIGLWNWEGMHDYLYEKSSQLNEEQRLQRTAKLFLWYKERLSKILETVKKKVGEIESNPAESSQRYKKQCEILQSEVDEKYEELKHYPSTINIYKDNAIDLLISEKHLKEEEIPETCYHRFTQDDLLKHLVYRRFVESQDEATSCETTEEKLCTDPTWNELLKTIVSQLPTIMEIQRTGKIKGLHIAFFIKWFKEKMKETARMDVKIIQKNLLTFVKKTLGNDYRIFKNPSNINEAMKMLNHESTHVSPETVKEYDKSYATYKQALDRKASLGKGQQSA